MMETFILIAVAITGIVIWALLNWNTPNQSSKEGETSRVVSIDLTPYTWKEDFELAGVHIEPTPRYIINWVKPRHPVTIYHEKDNKYSSRALAVKHEGVHIGYIKEDDIDQVNELLKKPHLILIEKAELQGYGYLYVSINIYY
ncbi:MAG TPA: hypothetical protein PKH16_10035 [Aequorivita sp.]|nr:hypothetical protein [Aequorivita sp.]